jgi:hypothetical protein
LLEDDEDTDSEEELEKVKGNPFNSKGKEAENNAASAVINPIKLFR